MAIIIDATNKSLGRLASEIAKYLMGKHKPDWYPHKDTGETVIVNNFSKIKIDKKKWGKKYYFKFGRKLGSLKKYTLKQMWEKDPKKILIEAVSGMLPKNKLRKKRLKRLIINL